MRFWRDERGNFAILFGICVVPVQVAAGTAFDQITAALSKLRIAK